MLRIIEYFAKSLNSLKVIRNDTVFFRLRLRVLFDVKYHRDLDVGQRSLKVIEIGTIRNHGYGFHFPLHSQ